MGIDRPSKDLVDAIENKSLKGLFIMGEDVENIDLKKLEFLVVQDLYLTPTAQVADVVLPAVSYAESTGTFTNSERRIQRTNAAIPPLSGYKNWEVINEMMFILGMTDNYKSLDELTEELSKDIKEYTGLYMTDKSPIWTINDSDVLYVNGFNFDDGQARLAIVEDGKLFQGIAPTDFVEKEFEEIVANI